MTRRPASPSVGTIRSPSQGPHFTRSIRTLAETDSALVAASTYARIIAGVAFAGGGFCAAWLKIPASCCLDILPSGLCGFDALEMATFTKWIRGVAWKPLFHW